jgi:tripartite-type tricarboxylate transporter receptor subunit TctC
MNFRILKMARIAAAMGVTLGVAAAAQAQSFPTKGIQFTMGFGPGSGIDSNSRLFAPYLSKQLGVPVTIINQPGGGSVPWANGLARAKPDGYTIGIVGFPLLQNNSVLSKVNYDPLKDFTYLGVLTVDPAVLADGGNSDIKSLSDLIDAAKKEGSRTSVGATGKGSVDYLVALSIERATGAKFGIVNFDSTNEGIVATMGGSLSAMPMTVSAVLPYVQSGQLRVLAAGDKDAIPELPGTKTFSDYGVKLLAPGSIRAFLAPAGLPADVKAKLAGAIKAAMNDPEFEQKAAASGLKLVYMSPEEEEATSISLVKAAQENLK